MAIKRIKKEWCACIEDFRCEFIVDTNADFEKLPKACPGSTALSAESGDVMVVNASGEWVKMGG